MKKLLVIPWVLLNSVSLFAQQKSKTTTINSKLEQDKAAIKSMVGIYKVTFDFAETFSPDTNYNIMTAITHGELNMCF
jgi:hypothetical protein